MKIEREQREKTRQAQKKIKRAERKNQKEERAIQSPAESLRERMIVEKGKNSLAPSH